MRYVTLPGNLSDEEKDAFVETWKAYQGSGVPAMWIRGEATYKVIKPMRPAKVRIPSSLMTHCTR